MPCSRSRRSTAGDPARCARARGGPRCGSSVRAELVARAAARADATAADTVIVVGDTVLDIEAARANDYLCVAVTTAGATIVLDRLADLIPWHQSRFG